MIELNQFHNKTALPGWENMWRQRRVLNKTGGKLTQMHMIHAIPFFTT